MNIKHLFIWFSSLICVYVNAQATQAPEKILKSRQILISADILNAALAIFTDRKIFQGNLDYQLRPRIFVTATAGFESNIYTKSGYDATASGPFTKIGADYMLVRDPENGINGFFLGGKLGASSYKQEYQSVPMRGYNGGDYYISMPPANRSAYWLEASAGGRVQLFETPWFVEVGIQPRYLLYASRQNDVKPMIVPGFGRSSSKFATGFSWNIGYRF